MTEHAITGPNGAGDVTCLIAFFFFFLAYNEG